MVEPALSAAEPAVSAVPVVPVVPLLRLHDGVPAIIDTADALDQAADALANGFGPVAVDAERASSYRYGQRAYLVQLRRDGTLSYLIDPTALPDLSRIGTALAGVEWVLHAAHQDLPCLAELGMRPDRLFDTELAARLAGFERVGLATMVETLLGWRIEKEHSAADWSRRPLPEPWLRYAALDVEVLVELRDSLEAELRAQGKLDWAREEFEYARLAPAAAERVDPWRRLSGIHRLRNRRQLAVARAMWLTRDELARLGDISPSRLLPDASIVAVAQQPPASMRDLAATAQFVGRGSRRHLSQWWTAISAAVALPDAELPPVTRHVDGPPPAHRWAARDELAAARLARARAAVGAVAQEHRLPTENLLQPDVVRRLAWQPPSPLSQAIVRVALQTRGARDWQIELAAEALTTALRDPPDHAAQQA